MSPPFVPPQLGDSLLHVAVNTGSFELISYLVNEHGLDVNERNVVSSGVSTPGPARACVPVNFAYALVN